MSVMNQLKKFSGEEGTYDRKAFNSDPSSNKGAEDLEDMMSDIPIAGQSLTQSPEQKLAFEGPPKFTDQNDFLEHLFNQLTSEDALPPLLDTLRKHIPVEMAAHKILQGQMRKGNINTDLILLSIEPTIYMLIALATYAGIDPVLYPEGDGEDEDHHGTMIDKFKQGAKELTEDVGEDAPLDINNIQAPTSVPKNLMDRVGKAVDALDSEETIEPMGDDMEQGEQNGVA